MMRPLTNAVWASLCMIAFSAPITRAQQAQATPQQAPEQPTNQSSAPIPAYRSPFASATNNGDDTSDEPQELAPDTHALSGAQNFSLGIPTARSYWQPRFDVSASADSNPLETPKGPSWGDWTSISGGVDVHRISSSNTMSLSYTSGGMFSNYSGISNGVVQGLSFVDGFAFHRSSLSFLDQLTYLPETSLGFGGLGAGALPGGTSLGLGSAFTPGQSILTGQGQNLDNSFATELNEFLTPRSSLTFVGGYSLLHYVNSDLLDFNNFSFRGGYNHQLTRNDTIAVSYTFSAIRYSNFNQSMNDHTAQVFYGRRVTGKLAFQVAVGPQVVVSRIPLSGNAGSEGGAATGTYWTQVHWALNTALQWQERRTGLGLTYNHSATGGSGVLAGAITDVVTGSVTRQVARTFANGITAGYSRNEGVSISGEAQPNQIYDYWFAGASLAHPMGRALGLTFSYQMQYQTSNSTFCIGPTCGTNVIRHLISVGVGYHERPILF